MSEVTDPTPTWVYACGFIAGIIHLFHAFLAFCLMQNIFEVFSQCSLSQHHCSKSVWDKIFIFVVGVFLLLLITGLSYGIYHLIEQNV